MHRRLNKTAICSVLCVDIVGHSRKPDAEQIVQKERFNALVEAALQDVPKSDRVILDTGDGAVIAFFASPEDAITSALLIRDAMAADRRPQHAFELRVGIDLGAIRVMRDVNGVFNIVGDGLNAAQQVMAFAPPGRILASHAYHGVVAPENPDIVRLFSYFGVRQDRDERSYEMHIVGHAPGPLEEWWRGVRTWLAGRETKALWLALVVLAGLGLFAIGGLLMRDEAEVPVQPVAADALVAPSALVDEAAPARHVPGSPAQPAGRVTPGCTEAERMLNHCQ